MAYSKPTVIAQNASTGSYAAGCPEKSMGGGFCRACDRAQ